MSDDSLAFVDTNVLVYAFDRSEKQRQKIAALLVKELISENKILLSTQILQEFFSTVTRKIKAPISINRALKIMDDFAAWPLFVVDYKAIREAGEICQKLRLSFWDALILVSASRMGAKKIYTEDLNQDQIILGVRVVNPFSSV